MEKRRFCGPMQLHCGSIILDLIIKISASITLLRRDMLNLGNRREVFYVRGSHQSLGSPVWFPLTTYFSVFPNPLGDIDLQCDPWILSPSSYGLCLLTAWDWILREDGSGRMDLEAPFTYSLLPWRLALLMFSRFISCTLLPIVYSFCC